MTTSIVSNNTAADFENSPQKTGEPLDHAKLYSGKALEFDGVTDYLNTNFEISEDMSNTPNVDHTIAIWVKMNSGGTYTSLFSSRKTSGSSNVGTGLEMKSNDKARIAVQDGTSHAQAESTTVFTDSQWHRVIGVCDRAAGTIKIYVDGTLEATTTSVAAGNASYYNNRKMGIGVYDVTLVSGLSGYFNGLLCDAQLWHKCWSEDDVRYDYLNPEKLITDNASVTAGITTSDLKLWYPMNGYSDPTSGSFVSTNLPVFDASNAGGLEDNLVTSAGTAADWGGITNATLTNTSATGFTLTSTTDGSENAYFGATGILSKNMSVGTYKVSFNASWNTPFADEKNIRWYRTGSGSTNYVITEGSNLFYESIDTANNNSQFFFNSDDAGQDITISDFKIQKVKQASHAKTEFYKSMSNLLTTSQKHANGLADVLGTDDNTQASTDAWPNYKIDFVGSDGTLVDLDSTDLVTNGTFGSVSNGTDGYDNGDNTVDGWTAHNSAHLSVASNKLKILNSTTAAARATYEITTVVGDTYEASVAYDTQTGSATECALRAGSSVVGAEYGEVRNTSNDPTIKMHFTATATTSYLMLDLYSDTTSGHYLLADNVSVKKIDKFAVAIQGQTGASGGITCEATFAVDTNKGALTAVNNKHPMVMMPFATTVGKEYRAIITVNSSTGHTIGGSPGGKYFALSDDANAYTGDASDGDFDVRAGKTFVKHGGSGGWNIDYKIIDSSPFTATGTTSYFYFYGEKPSTGLGHKLTGIIIEEIGIAQGWTEADQQQTIPQTALMNGSSKLVGPYINTSSQSPHYTLTTTGTTTSGTAYSISAWVMRTRIPGGQDIYLISGTSSATGNTSYNRIYWPSSSQVSWFTENVGINAASLTTYPKESTWEFWTFVSNSGTKTVYRNAKPVASASGLSITKGLDYDHIGVYGGLDTSTGFEGIIDELAVWNTSLSETEVQELYNDGIPLDAQDHSRESTLQAYWRNNNLNSAGKMKDLVGTNHATITTGTGFATAFFPEGKVSGKDSQGFPNTIEHPSNGAAYFDGVTNYINAGTNPGVDNTFDGGGTVEAWIKPVCSTSHGIMHKTNWNLSLRDHVSGECRVCLHHIFSTTNLQAWTNTRHASTNQWIHIVATYDNSSVSNVPIIYIDGTAVTVTANHSLLSGSLTPVGTRTSDSGNDIIIGISDQYFNEGLIDEIKIYNRILTAAEAKKNYKHGKAKHKN